MGMNTTLAHGKWEPLNGLPHGKRRQNIMKNGAEYRDVAKEIVNLFAKYDATVRDVEYILGWLDDEMKIQPIQESKD